MTLVSLTEVSIAYSLLVKSDYCCCLFSPDSDTVSVGEAEDLVELVSEPVEVTPLEPAGLHVEEVSETFQV